MQYIIYLSGKTMPGTSTRQGKASYTNELDDDGITLHLRVSDANFVRYQPSHMNAPYPLYIVIILPFILIHVQKCRTKYMFNEINVHLHP